MINYKPLNCDFSGPHSLIAKKIFHALKPSLAFRLKY